MPPLSETVYAAADVQVTETWPVASTLALSVPVDPKSMFWVDTRQLAATVAFVEEADELVELLNYRDRRQRGDA